MCEPCNFGMYQNLLGQTLCKSCSDGYTTAIVGAQDISLCTGNLKAKTSIFWPIIHEISFEERN